jgi:anaerobic dimethyl sulfoxide reductase subunit C (anchor subunit)
MNVKEWALIIFTILAQMSVGAFLVLGAVHLYVSRKADSAEADRMSDRALLAIIVTLGLGLLASLFHLGDPLSSPRAISNVATSWLSREILFGAGFAVLGALFAAMQWFKWGTFALRNAVAWLAGLVGVGLIYCMSRAYMLPTQPAWNTIATPISFYATSLLLGALALGVAFFVNYRIITVKHPDCADCQAALLRDVLGWLAVLAIAALGVEFVIIPIHMGILGMGNAAATASVKLMLGTYGVAFVLRLLLAFVGVAVFGVFMYQNAKEAGKIQLLGTLATSAFVLALAAELIGRYLFYATRVGINLL